MGDRALVIVDAPEGLNRLWFLGRCLDGLPPDGSEPLFEALRRDLLKGMDAAGLDRPRADWRARWSDALRPQRDPGVTPGGDDDGLVGGGALGEIRTALEAPFRAWWDGPIGARVALEWWTGQFHLPQGALAALEATGRRLLVDLVGAGTDVSCWGDHWRVGAGAVVRARRAIAAALSGGHGAAVRRRPESGPAAR